MRDRCAPVHAGVSSRLGLSFHAWQGQMAHCLKTGRRSLRCACFLLACWLLLMMTTPLLWILLSALRFSMLMSPASFATSSSPSYHLSLKQDLAQIAQSRCTPSSATSSNRNRSATFAPPPEPTRDAAALCQPGRLKASALKKQFYPAMSAARTRAKEAGDNTSLVRLRTRLFEPSTHTNLLLQPGSLRP